MNRYDEFLAQKAVVETPTGLDTVPDLNPELFPFQRDIVSWALRRGRAAIFADCGLGKTPMQLDWARCVPGDVLILAPLAVSTQTVREGEKFGIPVNYCRDQSQVGNGITITNYEMLDRFDLGAFTGVVLDESSILKAYDGKTRTRIIEAFHQTPFRLACTATPAPNDYMELGNHAEFLGTMKRMEMLSMFFVHDGGETQKWRLKGHAQGDFWKWVCSWAVMLRKPSDLGYSDDGFNLPPMTITQHTIKAKAATPGFLFPVEAQTLQERQAARRESVDDRVAKCAEMVNGSDDHWVIWCGLNTESAALANAIPDAVEVKGADSTDHKESAMLGFSAGDHRVMVTKPSIAGFGMNWQHCHNEAFVGLSDSYEQFYQAVRRCWRFGQTDPVDVHIITSELEGAVVANVKRKEADAAKMAEEMVRNMSDLNQENLHGTERNAGTYATETHNGKGWTMNLGDCVEGVGGLDDESIGYSVFSPPFASLYTYTNLENDMGNSANMGEFMEHFRFLIAELYRVTMPGRLASIHCMDLPTSKQHHGYIGLQDFRGDIIRAFQAEGWIYHSSVCIWKDPVMAMQRTKALGLLHKQIRKDSCMSRQGIPDYVVTMRKPGDNPQRVSHEAEDFPVSLWQRHASPIWMDIDPGDTLQFRSARDHKDERHICPLQIGVIRRCVNLWSNPDDLVLSPFAGIGSEGYVSVEMGRRFIGFELKESYYRQAIRNMTQAQSMNLFEGVQ